MDSLSERIASAVLTELNGHAGFDHWWDMVDDDTRDEIRQALAETVAAELERTS